MICKPNKRAIPWISDKNELAGFCCRDVVWIIWINHGRVAINRRLKVVNKEFKSTTN